MRLRQAATYLSERGYPCSAGTVRALVRAGKIYHRRVGASGRGRYEFTEPQLDRFLAEAEFKAGEPEKSALAERRPRAEREARPKPAAVAKAAPVSDSWAAYEQARKA